MLKVVFNFLERFLEENKKGIIVLFALIAATSVIIGHRYYKYSLNDPEFCGSCHMMQESFRDWQKSAHRDIICQRCHRMGILEHNRMLLAHVVRGQAPIRKQAHGRLEPWLACRACHIEDVKQGSVTLRSSYGHARHVFMQGIGCMKCHSSGHHGFMPNEKACLECHGDKLVHGMGMEGLFSSCLKCHSYGEKSPKMVSSERCTGCHRNVPVKGPMAMLQCFRCHKPHGKIKPESKDCLGECHGNEANVGQHGIHLKKAGVACLDCHKAHKWVVGKKEAQRLCSRCHPLKDPKTFIY